jgi:two-component system chemotaxis response regulator CheY
MLKTDSKILVVDDFETIRVVLKRCFAELGYTNIEEAADGEEAFGKIQAAQAAGQPYQLILSDLNMPKVTGVELLAKVKKVPELFNIPFVMVTAESEQKFVIQALSLGAVDYVVKPFSVQTLQKKLARISERLSKAAAA